MPIFLYRDNSYIVITNAFNYTDTPSPQSKPSYEFSGRKSSWSISHRCHTWTSSQSHGWACAGQGTTVSSSQTVFHKPELEDVRTQERENGESSKHVSMCSDKFNIIFWWGSFDWTPHKWGKVCSFPSSREPRHLTDAVSNYIQTWTSDHSDWKEMVFLIMFRACTSIHQLHYQW